MPLNTIYQLVHRQTAFTEAIENVYFYNHSAGTGDATDLGNDWIDQILPLVLDIQNENMHTVGVDITNLGDLGDFDSLVATGVGISTGAMLPSFNGISFTMKPDTRAVRKGGKRIAGMSEASQTNGIIDDTALEARIETYRLALGANLVGVADTWTPVIVKRVKTAVAGTTPTKYKYALPKVDADLVYAGILSVLTTLKVAHQVSRGN